MTKSRETLEGPGGREAPLLTWLIPNLVDIAKDVRRKTLQRFLNQTETQLVSTLAA